MKFVHDENHNRIEALSKEEIYALLNEAIQEGQLPVLDQDTAFVTMIKSIIDGKAYKIGFCTQAVYNQLEAAEQLEADCLYIITDDASYEELEQAISDLQDETASLESDIGLLQTRVARLENTPQILESTEQSEYKTASSIYITSINEGLEILVRFSYWGSTTTWHEMTLNVNNAGAKTITANGTTITPNDSAVWASGDLVKLRYEKKGSGYVRNVVENITQHILYGQIRDY